MVFDHLGYNVADFPKTRAFLSKALAPLGITVTKEGGGWAMVGRTGEGQLWFGSFGPSPGPIHVAFAAQVRRRRAAASLADIGLDFPGRAVLVGLGL